MNFNNHYHLEGRHAFLSASKYHWINYDDEKLMQTFNNFMSSERGTRLHELARQCIELNVKLPKTRNALNMYVNDAIGYKMVPEQILYYSDNCFGTCDTICFRKSFLRIHDLKNGVAPASMKQLEIYTALFCLEYDIKPVDIEIELRLYQGLEVLVHDPSREDIYNIMNKIIRYDKMIEMAKVGG